MKDLAIQSNRKQCLLAHVSTVVVAVCVCVGVTMNLVTIYDENFDHMGIRTFCMFTVNSNILAGISMLLCLPYTVDGLRTGNYHLPNWIVDLMYVAVTAVSLTFLISLFVLSPAKGFVLIFTGSRFFLHGVCPVLSIVTFCFFINSHIIRLRESLLALIPVFIYAVIYLVMVVFIGEEHGGWNDFYGFATRIPLWVPLLLVMPLTYGIAALVRLVHNKCCLRRRKKDAELYRDTFGNADLRRMVEQMARSRKKDIRIADILIPARLIRLMAENSGDDMSPEEGCMIYLNTFLSQNNEQMGSEYGSTAVH